MATFIVLIGFALGVGLICPLAGVIAWIASGRRESLREWMRRV